LDLALTNRVLSGEEAAAWGLVSRALDEDRLASTADEISEQLVDGAGLALAATKRMLRAGADPARTNECLDNEVMQIARLASTADGQEGIAAFLAKRRPVFTL
jgi:2-(1,2-epoxy-1,2-dihydrophenyl)acetyl-CoA isomerase